MIDPLLIDLPRSIETPRLVMRPPQAGDGAALHEALIDSLVELRRFLASLPWVAAEQTIESAESFCRNGESNFIARRDLPFLVFERSTGPVRQPTLGRSRGRWHHPPAAGRFGAFRQRQP